MRSGGSIYGLQILHEHKASFPFLIFSELPLKMLKDAKFLMFSGIIFHICGLLLEEVVQRCPVKKVFLKISQNSPESTCTRVSFLINLQA